MSLLDFRERVFSHHASRVPSIPELSSTELRTLSTLFTSQDQSVSLENLFGQNQPLILDQARQNLNAQELCFLLESGLVERKQQQVRARFQLKTYDNLLFLADLPRWEADPQFVLPVGPAGKYLALLTIRRPVKRTLDLGCGCGLQALLAARHSQRVIATDINPRALALTRLNAEMNGLDNVETRFGNFFEPVRGERFDLIVANLPYVISPEKHRQYRTANGTGLQSWLAQLADYLNPGGFAHLLLNWAHTATQDPTEPLRRVLQGSPLDAWLMLNGSKRPEEYADLWLKSPDGHSPQIIHKTKAKWLRWYRSQNIERLALGALTLRLRSQGQAWFRVESAYQALESPAGEQLLRCFDEQDRMEGQQGFNNDTSETSGS